MLSKHALLANKLPRTSEVGSEKSPGVQLLPLFCQEAFESLQEAAGEGQRGTGTAGAGRRACRARTALRKGNGENGQAGARAREVLKRPAVQTSQNSSAAATGPAIPSVSSSVLSGQRVWERNIPRRAAARTGVCPPAGATDLHAPCPLHTPAHPCTTPHTLAHPQTPAGTCATEHVMESPPLPRRVSGP